jgi:hypothetical protein
LGAERQSTADVIKSLLEKQAREGRGAEREGGERRALNIPVIVQKSCKSATAAQRGENLHERELYRSRF